MSTNYGSLDAAARNRVALDFHDVYGEQGRAVGNPEARSMAMWAMGGDMEEMAKKILGSMKQPTKMAHYESLSYHLGIAVILSFFDEDNDQN